MATRGIGNLFGWWSNETNTNSSDEDNDPLAKADAMNSKDNDSASEGTTKTFYFFNLQDGTDINPEAELKPGLNCQGVCSKKDCKRFTQINKSFSDQETFKVFNMKVISAQAKCAECQAPLVIKNCVLLDCVYEIGGQQENGQKIHKKGENRCSKTMKALSFGAQAGEENNTQWKSLYISAKPLKVADRVEAQNRSLSPLQALGGTVVVAGVALAVYFLLFGKSQPQKNPIVQNKA